MNPHKLLPDKKLNEIGRQPIHYGWRQLLNR